MGLLSPSLDSNQHLFHSNETRFQFIEGRNLDVIISRLITIMDVCC